MESPEDQEERIPIAVWICAFTFFALQIVFGPSYPMFRDEFYYLACADHLALGYVDHPPLSIFVLALWRMVFGESTLSLRVLPSLCGGLIVLLTSGLAKRLGGGVFAQTLAAISVLAAPTLFGITGFYSMNAFDFLFWLGGFHLLIRLLDAPPEKSLHLWRVLGVILGAGLLNKISVLALGGGIGAAIVLTPLRAQLRQRGPWEAAAIAATIFAPHILWQIRNDWPTLEFIRNASRYKNVVLGPVGFLKSQILDYGPLNFPIWMGGLAWLLLSARARAHRGVAIVFIVAFLAFMNGKAYYLAPALLAPLAAGAVWIETVFVRWSSGWPRLIVATSLIIGAVIPLPVVVPLLPAEEVGPYLQWLGIAPKSAEKNSLGVLPQHYADRFGWGELTRVAASAWSSLSIEEQARAIVVTSNYGEAGALNYFGRPLGLPRARSQHNNFFLWGPGNAEATIVVTVGISPDDLRNDFEDVQPTASLTHPLAMPYEREHPVTICRRPKAPLAVIWARGKHFI